ncbi:hypothetical protein [Micromonospora sp. NPDC005367]|uniref:hypothetical protein n=1 Tax=Micromonospora sp. NPDC005367 TaxID=3155590 RepID=UPI0033AD647D
MRIAGSVDVDAAMKGLREAQTVFHSEADFQHAYAWAVHRLDGAVQVRLEVRQDAREYLDLLCFGPQGRTAIEFKYFTVRWEGVDLDAGGGSSGCALMPPPTWHAVTSYSALSGWSSSVAPARCRWMAWR